MEKKVIEIDVNVQGANQGFDELEKKSQSAKARLKELKQELLNLDEGSVEFQKLSKEAGELQDSIGDLNTRIKNLASDTRGLDTLLEGAQAVTGAFAIGQGAIGLFGAESEQLEKSLMKVQSAMALVQGVQAVSNALQKESNLMMAIAEVRAKASAVATGVWATVQGVANGSISIGTVAMKIFNAVVNANPIFLLVTAITAVVGAFALFSEATESASEKNDRLNESIEKQNKALERNFNKLQSQNSQRLAMMEAEGASEKQLYEEKQRIIDLENNAREGQIIEFKAQAIKKLKYLQQALQDEDKEKAKAIKKEIDDINDKNKKLLDDIENFNAQKKLNAQLEANREIQEEKDRIAKQNEAYKKRQDDYKKHLAEMEAIRKRVEDINNSLIKDEFERKIAEENTRFQREYDQAKGHKDLMQALEAQHSDNILKIKQEQANKLWAQYDAEEKALQDKKVADNAKMLAELEASDDEWNAIHEPKAEAKTQRQINRDAWEAQSSQAKNQQILDGASSTLSLISSLTELFAGKSRKQQEKAFKVQKGVSIAQALIDTYKSANAAFQSMAGIPYVGPVLGGIAAAAAVAAGIVNVKKISSQKFEGGGDTGAPATPNVSALSGGGGGISAPQFTLAGATGINQINQSVNQQQPVKAYVVSSEVSTAQSLDRNKIETAVL
jgi:hypothetical protein